MNFADVAEDVLRRASGGPLHYREITRRALDDGLISPKSDQPWVYMAEAINADTRRRAARGDRPRFTSPRRGYFRLTAPSSAPEEAVKAWNEQSKRKLLARLGETEPALFEELIGQLLSLIGFEDIEITSRSRDGGVDVRGLLTVGGITRVSTAIEVKRWQKNVGAPTIRGLRGGLSPKEQGLIVTLADFTKDAVREASISDRAPITLIDGQQLVELLAEHGLGFRRRELLLLEVDEGAFVDQTVSEADNEEEVPAIEARTPLTAVRSPRTLFKLQGGPKNYLHALSVLLEHASSQPTVDEFLDRLQTSFPQITLRPVARRQMGVLLSLGFARLEGDRIALTPEGNAFLTSRNPHLVRDAIIGRIPGAAEIAPMLNTVNDPVKIHEAVELSSGSSITLTQVKRISQWLRQTR